MIFMHFQPSGRKLLRNPCLLHSMQWHAPVRFCCNSEQTWKKHIFMEGLCHWKSHETSQSRCSIRGAKFGTTGRQAHPNHLRIRNINPLTATYQCRFYIFMEWFDQAAIGMPPGDVSEDLVCNPPRLSFFVLGVFFEGSTTCWLYLMISSRRIERSFGFQRSPCKIPWKQAAVDRISNRFPKNSSKNIKENTHIFEIFGVSTYWLLGLLVNHPFLEGRTAKVWRSIIHRRSSSVRRDTWQPRFFTRLDIGWWSFVFY